MALALLVLAAFAAPLAEGGEVISDLVSPSADARRARTIKAEAFWTPLLKAAEGTNLSGHLLLFEDAEGVIADLPAGEVRDALAESLQRLQDADQLVLAQAAGSWQSAMECRSAAVLEALGEPWPLEARLDPPRGAKDTAERGGSGLAHLRPLSPPGRPAAQDGLRSPEAEAAFSFARGGQDFLRNLVRRFVDGGDYPERLRADVGKRQGEVLPALRGAAASAGDVLTNTRLASKRAFDALKYNIYVSRTPKTPEAATDVANRLVDAAGETRKHFMSGITAMVNGITQDVQGQHDDAGATVARWELGLGPASAPPGGITAGPAASEGSPLKIYAGSSSAEIGLQLVL
ncbi:unnamed protein product [Prorocentrum cordatum]|uniref:Uncharacterized protein n=1 Tax=Prorocentrum cordatum TaxID=2364126 RepID=A0ABN9VFK2_9DINO|nr:unnamed protein product [Polarella glacialis]